jgi:hypothetical protein
MLCKSQEGCGRKCKIRKELGFGLGLDDIAEATEETK